MDCISFYISCLLSILGGYFVGFLLQKYKSKHTKKDYLDSSIEKVTPSV